MYIIYTKNETFIVPLITQLIVTHRDRSSYGIDPVLLICVYEHNYKGNNLLKYFVFRKKKYKTANINNQIQWHIYILMK